MKANKYTKETILRIGIHDRKFPEIRPGDRVVVVQRIVEGDKERQQKFEGDIIRIRRHGIATNFTVRRMGAGSIGIERVFPYYSPMIADLIVLRRGDVRRAKLYYVRDRVGKASRISEMVLTAEERQAEDKKATQAVAQ